VASEALADSITDLDSSPTHPWGVEFDVGGRKILHYLIHDTLYPYGLRLSQGVPGLAIMTAAARRGEIILDLADSRGYKSVILTF
jgi:hypothetical protein